jgi:hypothetical protein
LSDRSAAFSAANLLMRSSAVLMALCYTCLASPPE